MDDTDFDKQQKLIEILNEICYQLGWQVAIPTQNGNTLAPGLIIGNSEFIDDLAPIITEVAKAEDYSIFESDELGDSLVEVTEVVKAKKHESYH